MNAVIFDVETTGLPIKRRAALTDYENWPHIVQISWIAFDLISNTIISINDYIIKTPVIIPEEAIKVHGITNEMSQNGVNIMDVLNKFKQDIQDCQIIVAHNLEFDHTIISVESLRNSNMNLFDGKYHKKFCTMRRSRRICNKWIKLELLHEKLFGEKPFNLHNSLIDVFVCFRCFYKLNYNLDILKMKTVMESTSENMVIFKNTYNNILQNTPHETSMEGESKNNDDSERDDAKSDDAKSDDAKSDDAKSDDAKSDDAFPNIGDKVEAMHIRVALSQQEYDARINALEIRERDIKIAAKDVRSQGRWLSCP